MEIDPEPFDPIVWAAAERIPIHVDLYLLRMKFITIEQLKVACLCGVKDPTLRSRWEQYCDALAIAAG